MIYSETVSDIWLQYPFLFPPVFPMVFYHGRSRWKIPDDFASLTEIEEDSPLREYIPQFRFRVYDISHLPDEEIRGKVMEKSVLMVAKHIFRPDLRHKLPEILSLFADIADRNTALEMIEVILRYVVRAKHFDEKDIGEILKQSDMGEDIMETFIDRYINQGLQQGLYRGELRFFRKMMESRFGSLPEWAREKIESAPPEMIEKWGIRLLSASRLEDVLNSQ